MNKNFNNKDSFAETYMLCLIGLLAAAIGGIFISEKLSNARDTAPVAQEQTLDR